MTAKVCVDIPQIFTSKESFSALNSIIKSACKLEQEVSIAADVAPRTTILDVYNEDYRDSSEKAINLSNSNSIMRLQFYLANIWCQASQISYKLK